MKRNIFLVLCAIFVFGNSLFSQVPEKIYGKNKVLKPNEYYLLQMNLWQKEIQKDSLNADAWYNYYRASRNAYIKGEEDNSQKAKGISRFDRLKNIVDQMENKVSDSYEYYFVKWLNGNNDLSLFPFLEKAHELSPKSSEPIMSLIFYYEIKGDLVSRDEKIEALLCHWRLFTRLAELQLQFTFRTGKGCNCSYRRRQRHRGNFTVDKGREIQTGCADAKCESVAYKGIP